MSVGGDAAEQLLQMELQVGSQAIETASRLVGLGAKNLAALLLALVKEHQKLKGKTSIDRLLYDGKPTAIFQIKADDLKKFEKLADEYGVLFHPVRNVKAAPGLMDIVVKEDDAKNVNRILEVMNYPIPGKEAEGKNAPARAPQEKKLSGRGNGLVNQINKLLGREDMEKAAAILEKMPPDVLASLIIQLSQDNVQSRDASQLSRMLGEGAMPICTVHISEIDAQLLTRQAELAGFPLHFQKSDKGGMIMYGFPHHAGLINRLFTNINHMPPIRSGGVDPQQPRQEAAIKQERPAPEQAQAKEKPPQEQAAERPKADREQRRERIDDRRQNRAQRQEKGARPGSVRGRIAEAKQAQQGGAASRSQPQKAKAPAKNNQPAR